MSSLYYLDSDIPRNNKVPIYEARTATDSDKYRSGDVVEIWDHVFRWDEQCIPQSKMEQWRRRGDVLADEALPIITGPAGKKGGTDLFARLEAAMKDSPDPPLQVRALWRQLHTQDLGADWPDAEQVRRGQAVFYRYALHILGSLLHSSLAGGFSSPRISRVLNIASYLVPPMESTPEGEAPRVSKESSDRSFRRLMETTQFVIDCMPGSAMEPGGQGWKATIRVRLLHATMRKRINDMIKKGDKLNVYNPETEGMPVSMEDMAATLSSFAPSPLICAMKVGLVPTPQECEDYVALWRVIGYYLGIDSDILRGHFSSYHASTRLYACSLINVMAGESDPPPPCQFPFDRLAPEIECVDMIHHTKTSTDPYKAPATLPVLFAMCHRFPIPFTFGQHCAATRQLLGPTMGDWLSVPKPTWGQKFALKVGFAWLNVAPWFAGRWRDGWDRRYRDAMRRTVEDATALELGNRHTKFRPRDPHQFVPSIHADEFDKTHRYKSHKDRDKDDALSMHGRNHRHLADLAYASVQWVFLYAEMGAVLVVAPAVVVGAAVAYGRGLVRGL